MHATLSDHLRHELLRLVRLDSQEVAELVKPDVHVNARDHHNVVLDQGLVKDRVAITHGDVLVVFQLSLEVFDVLAANDLSHEHLGE